MLASYQQAGLRQSADRSLVLMACTQQCMGFARRDTAAPMVLVVCALSKACLQ